MKSRKQPNKSFFLPKSWWGTASSASMEAPPLHTTFYRNSAMMVRACSTFLPVKTHIFTAFYCRSFNVPWLWQCFTHSAVWALYLPHTTDAAPEKCAIDLQASGRLRLQDSPWPNISWLSSKMAAGESVAGAAPGQVSLRCPPSSDTIIRFPQNALFDPSPSLHGTVDGRESDPVIARRYNIIRS